MSDPITPNSPTLSRTVKARVSANEFSALLQRTVLDNPPTPVKILLEEDGVSIWTHDAAKTIQLAASLFISSYRASKYSLTDSNVALSSGLASIFSYLCVGAIERS